MILSHLYNYALILCGTNTWQVDSVYPLIAWSFDTGNYIIVSVDGTWAMCFYTFCNLSDLENLDDSKYAKLLSRRQILGEVVIPYLVCGKIFLKYRNFFREIMREKGVKKMVFYKWKTQKFYIMEV